MPDKYEDLEAKLEALREQYRTAAPADRPYIALRGKALALKLHGLKTLQPAKPVEPQSSEDLYAAARAIFRTSPDDPNLDSGIGTDGGVSVNSDRRPTLKASGGD